MRKNYFLVLLAILLTANGIAQNIPSYVPKDGLVGYWPFNGNANDESGNGHHGTNNGATLTTDRSGKSNSAYNFGGTTNGTIGINLDLPYGDFTFSFWFNASDTTKNVLIDWRNNADGKSVLSFAFDSNYGGFVSLLRDNFNFETVNVYSNFSPYGNKWNFVSLSKDSNKVSFFINGKLNSTAVYNQSTWTLNHLHLGNNFYDPDWYYTGALDDISIFNRNLSEKEISNLYLGCSHEAASSNAFNSFYLTSDKAVDLVASPTGGSFSGTGVKQGKFEPASAKIGANKVQYNFKNSQGCNDSTLFTMIVADTVGTTCKKYDTVIVPKTVTKYDTITVTNNVTKYDTVIVPKTVTKYDTVIVKNNVYDTVIVPKTVTKYDTITVKNNVYDTVIVPKTVTKYDTVKVNKYDTITVTNNVTKYDTVIVNKTKYDTVIVPKTITKYDTVKVNTYDTITVTNTVTKYDTVLVNKFDTITVTDTVNILKINFKLTTGIKANQMTSMSIYPNPTSDVLIIDASDLAAITGYSYRILDVLGKEVYNALVSTAKTEISLKTLGAKGMYVLHILDANKHSVQTKQIILE